MMTKPQKLKDLEEICPMCKRLKSKHTNEELLVCTRNMNEFKLQNSRGTGIE